MMLRRTGGVVYFQFPALAGVSGVRHAVFTRQGGAGEAPFDSLNTAYSTGDRRETVDRNRDSVVRVLDGGELAFARQVHGADALVVEAGGVQEDAADALITEVPGIHLVIQVADCQAILLCDPGRRVVANIHSGWRGSIADIIGRTVSRMVAEFGADPPSMLAAVGPSLGPCCAEFVNYRREIPGAYWGYRVAPVHFDFWALSRDQLRNAGLRDRNIHCSNICTRCNRHLFFSYRGEGTTGRFAAAIGLT